MDKKNRSSSIMNNDCKHHDILIHGESAEPSCVSMKSDVSMDPPPAFSLGDFGAAVSNTTDKFNVKHMDSVFQDLEHKIISLMKKELEIFKRLLSSDSPACSEREEEEDEDQIKIREKLLKITLHVLKKMNQTNLADKLQTKLAPLCVKKHKSRLKEKFQRINEGISSQGNSRLVNKIYTELYITEGGSEELNNEHEVRQIETTSRRSETQETPIKCNDIFKALPGQDKHIRTVLTKGVAGIGKTVSVQKFILDWSEGKANQDIHFIFPLPFRELNLMKNTNISLMDLLHQFFIYTKELRSRDFDDYKVVFIFDGLDECRLPLDFSNNQSLFDVRDTAPVDVLLTNLIKGNLLPSALIWITSRPAAANQIPPDCVHQITDVRGFNDPQKDEYFIKRINDESLSNRIIKHIKSSRSLYIMCHIPVFCWITATVLERMLSESESQAEIPKTLTQMFTHFLIFQTKLKSEKYDGKCEVDLQQVRKSLLSLGKLAFQQLEKGNLIFYEEDLRECNIDVRDASVYSGVCTQIFKEEFGLNLGKVYSFVHLSIQEFLASLFVFLSFSQQTSGLFSMFRSTMSDLLKSEVDKALQSENGHLDLYLRFLLGLLLESNQMILRDLLTQTGRRSDSRQEIVEYIKMKIRDNQSPEKSINLFHCLNELNDQSLVNEIQTYLNRKDNSRLSGVKLSTSQWSAVVFVLLNSDQKLDEFILSKYDRSDECLHRLLPVIKASRKANLKSCNLTKKSCSSLSSVLISNSSSLTELNLSENKLQDSGVKLLSDGLKNTNCELKILQLSNCSITEEGYKSLALALELHPSHLTELDLTGNDPGESGVKKLTDVQKKSNCTLKTLKFLSPDAEKGCQAVMDIVQENPLLLTELKLTKNKLTDTTVKHLAALLEDKHCKLKTIQFNSNSISEKGCVDLLSAFNSNPSNLKELDLSDNKVRDEGMEKISTLLNNPLCMLEKLKFSECGITEKGYKTLVSTLRSGCSHVTELDLSGNYPGETGVNILIDLLEQPNCTLKTLRYLKSPAAEEACKYLTEVLGKNPLLLKELDLSRNELGGLDVEKLSALLIDSHTRLEKIRMDNCDLTEKNCLALAGVLSSNTILKEMDLSNNRLLDSGVKQLCNKLKTSKLQILKLSNCSITEEGYKSLASALESNSSHLTVLDLTGNDPGESGVKKLTDVQKKSNGTLKTLRFLKGPADEGCQYVMNVLKENPLLMKVLNLSTKTLDDKKVKQLAAILEDKHCKPKTLQLNYCGLTEQSCSTLAGILKSNSSLNELDISNNTLRDSGVEKLQNGLKSSNCKLKILRMSECSITEEGYKSLASALESNPSHLSELDLTGNDPGESGVKMLIDVQKKSKGTLKTLRFLKGPAEEGCKYVKNVLNENPLLLREFNLSKKLDDTKVKQLAALLEDKHCKLKTLQLCECSIKDNHCKTLTEALCSNPSNLRELNFSGNALHNGVKHLCDLLKDSHCKLEKLDLSKCSITEELCEILTAALCSNLSYLRELNLSGNDLKDEGLKHLCDLLKSSRCRLEKLGLNNCKIKDVGLLAATKAVSSLKELDLRKNSIGDSKKQLIEVLETSSCYLKLDSESFISEITDEVTSYFKSKPEAQKSGT
ncbi:NACHT, LRR and PYD domains-containing protein 12-like [Paramisgurnus dabryanus]|uniref:NACHT, LRR and PYD domains-containing protein 12-like n=1 Tax=Paramisgurnus dabryanus TaxID=90735 RepID=UPI0031F3AE34